MLLAVQNGFGEPDAQARENAAAQQRYRRLLPQRRCEARFLEAQTDQPLPAVQRPQCSDLTERARAQRPAWRFVPPQIQCQTAAHPQPWAALPNLILSTLRPQPWQSKMTVQ